MPTYAYTCTSCQHGFEVKQSFTDDALTTCPECSGRLRKVFNSVGVVFKGSGFYRNDSRKPESSGSAASSSGSDAGSGSGASKEGSGSKDAAASTSGSKDSAGSTAAKPAASTATSTSSSAKSPASS